MTEETKWINCINITNTNAALALHDARITDLSNTDLINDSSYVPTSKMLYNDANITIAGISIDTVNSGIYGTRVISKENLLNELGITNPLRFKGTTTAEINDGDTNFPNDIYFNNDTPQLGDVVINQEKKYEYIWTENGWEEFGYYQLASTNNYGQVKIDSSATNAITVNNGVITVPVVNSAAGITSGGEKLPTASAITEYISQYVEDALSSFDPGTSGGGSSDENGQFITDIESSGTTVTFSRADGTSETFTTQDTWIPVSTTTGGYISQLPENNGENYYLRGDNTWAEYNAITETRANNLYVKKTGDSMTGNLFYRRPNFTRGENTNTTASASTIAFQDSATNATSGRMGSIECNYIADPGYMQIGISVFENKEADNRRSLNFKAYSSTAGATTGSFESAKFRAEFSSGDVYFKAGKVFNAVFNDYAEYRETKEEIEPGRVVCEVGDGTLELSSARLQRGAMVVSDTFGTSMGQTERCNTPIAVAGRVLAYCLEGREYAANHIGYPVCAAPGGMISVMTEAEEAKYPSRIIGTISEIPTYDTWGSDNIKVNNRIWIKI